MGAVRGRKSVVDVKIAQRGEALHDGRVVLFLAAKEARILKQGDVARLKRRDRFRVTFPIDKAHLPTEHMGERLRDLGQGEFGGWRFRPAEMGEHQHDCALVRQFGQRWRCGAEPRVIRDARAVHRHVQILADEHAFATHVTDIVERLEGSHAARSFVHPQRHPGESPPMDTGGQPRPSAKALAGMT
jgi:hypothetical protein